MTGVLGLLAWDSFQGPNWGFRHLWGHGFCPEEVLGGAWQGGRPAQGPRRHRFDGQGHEGRAPVADDRHQGTACVTPQSKEGPMGALGSDPALGFRPKPVARGSFQNVVWPGHSVGPLLPRSKDRGLGEGERLPWAWPTPCHRHRQDQLWRQWLTPARPGRVLCLSLQPAETRAQLPVSRSTPPTAPQWRHRLPRPLPGRPSSPRLGFWRARGQERVVALVVGVGVAVVRVERTWCHWWPSFTAHSCCAWR